MKLSTLWFFAVFIIVGFFASFGIKSVAVNVVEDTREALVKEQDSQRERRIQEMAEAIILADKMREGKE